MKLALLPFLALLAVSSLSNSAAAADARGFDIIGIRLGMTVAEVEALATANGFGEIKKSAAPSFDQAVALENRELVNWQDYKGVQLLKFENDSESVQVFFVATPTGARAARISYSFYGSGVTNEQMTSRVLAKYGEPDGMVGGHRVWGDTALPFTRSKASLEYNHKPAGGFGRKNIGTLDLSGPELQVESKRAIETAAAERASGKKPNF